LLAFGALGLLYSFATPLFEAPDEPWHYAYVRWLAEGHGLPRLDDDASGAYQEVAQPPLYYGVAALVSSPVADDDLPELFWHNPQFGYQAGGTVNENKNMLIHTDRERFPWHGAVLAVRLARLVSLAFGLLTVGAAWGLAREAMPGRPALATMAAGAVAFTPQFLFISGVVNNDSATAATCTCALWALARIVRRGVTRRRAAVAGLALGLALLSKTSALLLLPLALLALRLSKHPANQSTRPRGVPIYKLTNTLLMLGLAGAVGGWWYLRNWILFDDPLGLSVHVDTPWGREAPASLATLLSELPQVFRSFWGAFGWGHVELPGWLYVALGGLVGLAVAGWGRHLLRYRQTRVMANASLTPISARICLLAALWYLAVLAALLRWMQQVEAPHGRLLFPALGAWGLLLAVGWSGLEGGRGSVFGIGYWVLGIGYSVLGIRPLHRRAGRVAGGAFCRHPARLCPAPSDLSAGGAEGRDALHGGLWRSGAPAGLPRGTRVGSGGGACPGEAVLGRAAPDGPGLHPVYPPVGARQPEGCRAHHLSRPGPLPNQSVAGGARLL
jgi:hypothetical protein